MKTHYILLLFTYCTVTLAYSQNNVAIGDTYQLPHPSASLELQSTNKGFLLNRLTTSQRDSIQNPATSLMIFNTTNDRNEYFDGSVWVPFVVEQEKPLMFPVTGINFIGLFNLYIDRPALVNVSPYGSFDLMVRLKDKIPQRRSISFDWPGIASPRSAVLLGNSVYLLCSKTTSGVLQYRLYRYSADNLSIAPVLVSGINFGSVASMVMTSDGVSLYFTFNAGNSTDDYRIAKYSFMNTTTLNYETQVVCGNTVGFFERLLVDKNGSMYGFNDNTDQIVKFTDAGAFVYQFNATNLSSNIFMNFDGDFYAYLNNLYYVRFWLE